MAPYAQVWSGQTTYLHHDQIGSVRVATNSAGAKIAAWTWDPYGNQTAATGNTTVTRFGWAGEYRDTETNLVYLRARHYDPTTAQFLQRDPLALETGEADGYGAANPLSHTDPVGLYPGDFLVNAAVEVSTLGIYDCADILDANCTSVAEANPEKAQAAANYAGGLMDQVMFGYGEETLEGLGMHNRVRWDSGWTTAGRLSGAGFQTVMGAGSGSIATTNSVGWFLSGLDTCRNDGVASGTCGWAMFSSAVGAQAIYGKFLDAKCVTDFYNGLSNFMSVWKGPEGNQ